MRFESFIENEPEEFICNAALIQPHFALQDSDPDFQRFHELALLLSPKLIQSLLQGTLTGHIEHEMFCEHYSQVILGNVPVARIVYELVPSGLKIGDLNSLPELLEHSIEINGAKIADQGILSEQNRML